MSALDNARALLPENYQGWDCDGSAAICGRRVRALRDLITAFERVSPERCGIDEWGKAFHGRVCECFGPMRARVGER